MPVQEFTLQSGDFNAEFGHSTGGVVNASLKSGTNGVHGDLWEYVRNNDLNANYFFNRTCSGGVCTANPVPSYHQNLFGFTAGGPVLIPHVINGKNRLFWFADYQGGRYVLPEPDGNLTVPSKGMVSSNFTNLQDNIAYNYLGHLQRHRHHRLSQGRLGPRLLQRHHHGSGFNPPAFQHRCRRGNRAHRHAECLCARSFL